MTPRKKSIEERYPLAVSRGLFEKTGAAKELLLFFRSSNFIIRRAAGTVVQ